MSSDLRIAQKAKMKPIREVAKSLGIPVRALTSYGDFIAKVSLNKLKPLKERKKGKYVVVTAITPTPLGEGKTVTTIGLSMALSR